MKLSHLKNKTICILGYGREGQSTHQWLIDNQITDQIILADDQAIQTKDQRLKTITIHDQSSRHDHLEEYDIIIRTAGIAPHTDLLADYREKITSQTQIFFDNYTGVTIGVTGTKGKSTTSTLIAHILQAAGHTTQLVGNIGNPVLSDIDLLDQSKHPDFIVYELSSFQLTEAAINPTYAIITNLLEDHLDRHGSCDHYHTSKLNIMGPDTQLFAHASTVDIIYPKTKDQRLETIYAGSGTEYDFDPENFATPERHYPTDILLPGDHNRENICLINALMHHLQIAPDTIYESIRAFGGLPHRLQLVSEKNSIRRIDDSQSTNPSTCVTAIRTYGEEISTLMLGGYQSHFDYAPVFDMIRQYPSIQTLILFPDTIGDFRKHITTDDTFTTYDVDSMRQAVQIAAEHTTPGSICLLSPGAKSFSLRTSMSQRGDEFAACIDVL